MRGLKVLLGAISLLLAIPVGGRTAYAHGGQYRGPAGEVPPDSRQPEDPPPPETGGGTPTPPDGGGGTPTPPPDGGGGTPTPPPDGTPDPTGPTGGTVPQPGTPGGGGTKTGSKVARKGPSYESWLFWWNYNKDEIINLKNKLRSGLGSSGTGLGLGGFAEGSGHSAEVQNVTQKAIEQRVVPILMECARDSKLNFDIQASGVIGLAKVGRKDAIPLLMEIAQNRSGEYHKVVEETAALALGIMQERSPQVRQVLQEIATDTTAKYRTRCFAMFALGLLGEKDAVTGSYAEVFRTLKSIVSNPSESSRDVTCSALVAIGLLGDRAAVPELLQWLNEEKAGSNKLPDLQLSYVVAALGKIGQPGLAGPDSREVVDALKDQLNKKARMTRFSSVIALGQVAPQADEKTQKDCVSMLSVIIKNEGKATSDPQTVSFALASLGRIAGAKGCPEAVRTKAMETIGEPFADGRPLTKSFAALALGIAGMELPESQKAQLGDRIRAVLAKTSGDVDSRGAFCISLGLLKDIKSVPVLLDILNNKGEDKPLRGTAAVALGLIGDRSALDPIRQVLKEKSDQKLRVDAAVAAGLLKDTDAVPSLVEILQDPKSSQFILGSCAQALGQIGDERAVDPLASILKDEKKQYPDLTRALSAVSLAQIGDKDDVPVLARLSRDVNYRAYYEAIGEVLTIL
jgi:HEAT repeat protein